ncbi:MAG: serine/threonine protein kinase [Tyzzerella sp.]|nr:serine/threonine protein kinase [Tyzzerella sp.]
MLLENQYPLSTYQDITPLCKNGHVMLVQNERDGKLYVKKQLLCYNLDVYLHLQKNPVNNTPNIYGIYQKEASSSEDNNNLIVIEEYLPGSTLEELLVQNGCFSEMETIDIAMQLCKILMELHKSNPSIIHRDIKPSNLLISPEKTVYLLDFNAAKPTSTSIGRDTTLLGTAGFAAPEQYGFSASSPQTDIYAVGVLINTLLIGKLPSEQIANGKLKRVILHCLEINPKDRYHNVKELYYALKRVRDVYSELLPPGFRTMCLYKMLIALAGYAFIIAVTVSTEILAFLFIGILTVAFYCNYLHIRDKLPLINSQHKALRIIGFVLAPFIIYWGAVILIVLFEAIVSIRVFNI